MGSAVEDPDPTAAVLVGDLAQDGLKVGPPKVGGGLEASDGITHVQLLGDHDALNLVRPERTGEEAPYVQKIPRVLLFQRLQDIMEPLKRLGKGRNVTR